MTSYAKHDQTCESLMMPIQKNSRSTCFSCLPQQLPGMLSREIGVKTKLVPRLHKTKSSNQT
jgi:hypothetical protein